MKKTFYVLMFLSSALFGQYKDGKALLKAIHKKYAGNYCQTITFDQRTTRFDTSGVISDTSYLYEWISYPDKFRIDFGKKFGGNCVIFKNDSIFNYRNNKLVKKDRYENDLLLLLGGMYFRSFDSVLARMERAGYGFQLMKKISDGHIGLGSPDGHEIAIDRKDLRIVLIKTKLTDKDWLEIYFDEFKKTCKGFTETKVSAYKNGKLEQKEEYLNLKTSIAIPDSIFNKK